VGILARFNLKAQAEGQRDIAALNLLTELIIIAAADASSAEAPVDLRSTMNRATESLGQDLARLGGEHAGSLRTANSLVTLDIVARGILQDLLRSLGSSGTDFRSLMGVAAVAFDQISDRILYAARKGYVDLSMVDALALCTFNQQRIAIAIDPIPD